MTRRKRKNAKWIKIGAGIGGTLTGLLALFILAFNFQITGTDDICAGTYDDPCISYINITNPQLYDVKIYNPNEIKFTFTPQVREFYLFIYTENKTIGYNNITFEDYSYLDLQKLTKKTPLDFPSKTQLKFILYGLKLNPEETVKWSLNAKDGYLDPTWTAVTRYLNVTLNGVQNHTLYEYETNATIGVVFDLDYDYDDFETGNDINSDGWDLTNVIGRFTGWASRNVTAIGLQEAMAGCSNCRANKSVNLTPIAFIVFDTNLTTTGVVSFRFNIGNTNVYNKSTTGTEYNVSIDVRSFSDNNMLWLLWNNSGVGNPPQSLVDNIRYYNDSNYVCYDIDININPTINYTCLAPESTFQYPIDLLRETRLNDTNTSRINLPNTEVAVFLDNRTELYNATFNISNSAGTPENISISYYNGTQFILNNYYMGRLLNTDIYNLWFYSSANYKQSEDLTYIAADIKTIYMNVSTKQINKNSNAFLINNLTFQINGSTINSGGALDFEEDFRNNTNLNTSASTVSMVNNNFIGSWDSFENADKSMNKLWTNSIISCGTFISYANATINNAEDSMKLFTSSTGCAAGESAVVSTTTSNFNFSKIRTLFVDGNGSFIRASSGGTSPSNTFTLKAYLKGDAASVEIFNFYIKYSPNGRAGDDCIWLDSTYYFTDAPWEMRYKFNITKTSDTNVDWVWWANMTHSCAAGDVGTNSGSTSVSALNPAQSWEFVWETTNAPKSTSMVRGNGTVEMFYLNTTGIYPYVNTTGNYNSSNITAVSNRIKNTTNNITSAVLNADYFIDTDTNVIFQISSNNGVNWTDIDNLGVDQTITVPGTDLKWRTIITNSNTSNRAYISKIYVDVIEGSTENISIGIDAVGDWKYNNILNKTNSPQNVTLQTIDINSYISENCLNSISCMVPIQIQSAIAGVITIYNFNYTYNINPIEFNASILDLLSNTIRYAFNFSNGNITINDLKFDYRGSKNMTIRAHTPDYNINSTLWDLLVKYSIFNVSLPSGIDIWNIYPITPNDKNLEPFGQSETVPIFNITNLAYDRAIDVVVKFNETVNGSCMDMSLYNTSNFITTPTWLNFSTTTNQNVTTNIALNSNYGLWMRVNLTSCNETNFNFLDPVLAFNSYCTGCIRS